MGSMFIPNFMKIERSEDFFVDLEWNDPLLLYPLLCSHSCVHACVCVCVRARVCVCDCECMCVCVCVCVYDL